MKHRLLSISTTLFALIMPAILVISCDYNTKMTDEYSINIQNFHLSDIKINNYDSISVSVILPPSYKVNKNKRYPVIYFLPGYNQNDSIIYDLKIDSLLENSFKERSLKEFIFVTFDNKNNNYYNWIGNGRLWSDFISNSLINTIDSRFRTLSTSSKRGIYGVSMGGEGALYNGLKSPHKFGVIMSHSASIHYTKLEDVFDWTKPFVESYFSPIYGSPITQKNWQEHNVIWIVENKAISKSQKIYFDVGNEDHLEFYKTNILLSQKFNDKLIPHTFSLREGGHGNKFYMKNMMKALKFWDSSL